jgi:hypothetical protein
MAAFEVGLIFRMDWILAAEQVSEHKYYRAPFRQRGC